MSLVHAASTIASWASTEYAAAGRGRTTPATSPTHRSQAFTISTTCILIAGLVWPVTLNEDASELDSSQRHRRARPPAACRIGRAGCAVLQAQLQLRYQRRSAR